MYIKLPFNFKGLTLIATDIIQNQPVRRKKKTKEENNNPFNITIPVVIYKDDMLCWNNDNSMKLPSS